MSDLLVSSLGVELQELCEKIDRLDLFMCGDAYKELDEESKILLREQQVAMVAYQKALKKRYLKAKGE